MKNLKVTLLPFIAVLFASMLIFSSCDNNGDIDRSLFVGAYDASESCDGGGTDSYTLTISENSGSEDGLFLDNFYGTGDRVTATVNGDKVDIANQTVNGTEYRGDGKLDGNVLTIDFTVSSPILPLSIDCELICTKQ